MVLKKIYFKKCSRLKEVENSRIQYKIGVSSCLIFPSFFKKKKKKEDMLVSKSGLLK